MAYAKKKRHLQMAADVHAIYAQVDRHIQSAPEFGDVTCKRGCAACCRMMMVVTYPEAVALVTRYPKEVERARAALEADLQVTIEIAIAAGVAQNAPQMLDPSINERMCEDWWQRQRACPFLSPDNDCTVYDARPLACRGYHVRNGPEVCAQVPCTDDVEIVKLTPENEQLVIAAFGNAYYQADPRAQFTCGPFAEMVLYARRELRDAR